MKLRDERNVPATLGRLFFIIITPKKHNNSDKSVRNFQLLKILCLHYSSESLLLICIALHLALKNRIFSSCRISSFISYLIIAKKEDKC